MNSQQSSEGIGSEKNPLKAETERKFPVLKHRPVPIAQIPPARSLAAIRAAMQKNPDVNLPAEAAGVITAGLADPLRFRMLTEPHTGANGQATSLLNRKRVSEGTLYVTPQHDRFIDMGVLPDVAGSRWTHTLHNQLDVVTTDLPTARLGTAVGASEPWAMLQLDVADHDELVARITESFLKTVPDHGSASNDYTDSILQSGVKEPLLLVPMRVTFEDGSDDEYYLVSADGNSRLVSMWKGRTGGTVAEAAAACVKAVVGGTSGSSWKRVTQRQTRDRLSEQVRLVNLGLEDAQLTESTIRAGHTLTAPTAVVVGGRASETDGPIADMAAAREDLIATIHTDATPWSEAAQAEQGMSRLLRRAVRLGIITADEYRVIEGQCTVAEMHDLVGLPQHRLWAAALTMRAILNPWYDTDGTGMLFREEFNYRNPTRLTVGKQIASTALSGYRSSRNLSLAVNAFSDGGSISTLVWDYRWELDQGDDPVAVLDSILDAALNGKAGKRLNARIQLCALGGTAAMVEGLITRDRGSKTTDDGKRTPGKVPFRARPYRVIDALARTEGGLRTLHSVAVGHVLGKPAKQFRSSDDPDGQFHDGDPLLDAAGAHANLELEWDIVTISDPARAAEAVAAASPPTNGQPKDETVRLRQQMQTGAREILRAVEKLGVLAKTGGADVFGSYDAVTGIKTQLQAARDLLSMHGPQAPAIFEDDDEDEGYPDLDEDDA